MSEQSKKTVKKCLERVELTNKPTLIITEEFKRKVDFLHKKVGGKEWSGELITREEGCITDLDGWKIIAEDIFLVDLGSPGFTSYEVDKGSFTAPDIIELYDAYPGLLDGTLKAHHIHTHHNMGAFFSSIDWENLEDRAAVSNYFLMLIVNFKGDWCAKVAYKGLQRGNDGIELEFANNADGFIPLKLGGRKDKNILVVMDCKLEVENVEIEVNERFKARYEAVLDVQKREEEEAKKKREQRNEEKKDWHKGEYGTWKDGKFKPDAWSGKQWNQGMMGYGEESFVPGGWWDEEYEGDDDYEYIRNEKGIWEWVKKEEKKKQKKISQMTEKEWNKSQEEGAEKFDVRHARAFLNSILHGTYMPSNFNDCMAKIEEDNKGLTKVSQLEQYIDDFEEMLQEHFDVIWPMGTVEQYNELLGCVIEYLFPYKYNRLVNEMIDCVEEEIKITSNII